MASQYTNRISGDISARQKLNPNKLGLYSPAEGSSQNDGELMSTGGEVGTFT